MAIKIVTITAGHSDSDPGATNGLFREADIAADARNIIVYYLKTAGIQTRTDGEGFGNLPLPRAIQLIDGSVLAVEVHCNAFSDKKAGGTEALAAVKHKAICQKMCGAIATVMGIKTRGSDGGWKSEGSGQHSRLGYVRGGGIILELFFITNEAELAVWNAKKWLICKAIANEIIEYVKKLN